MIHFNLPALKNELEALENQATAPDFWDDMENSGKVLRKTKALTQRIEDILPTFNRGMILRQGDILAYGTRDEVLTEANLRRAFDLDIRLIQARNGRLWTVIE